MKAIEADGTVLVGVSYDSSETLQRAAAKHKITFPLLSDAGSKTIDAYGIRNKEAAGSRIDGVPYPMTFVLDQKGLIQAKLGRDGYRERHPSAELVKALKAIQ